MTRSLRIAILVQPFGLRGPVGEHAPALARELLGRGHSVRGFGAPPGSIPRSSPESSSDGSLAPEEGLGPRAFGPDIVLAYGTRSPNSWLGARLARKLGVPLFIVDAGVRKQRSLPQRLALALGKRLASRSIRSTATGVVAVDPALESELLVRGYARERVELLPTGVDLAAFRPGLTSRLIPQHAIRGRLLLHVGRLEPDRGLELLIDAFSVTVGQRLDWSLVLVGDGSARGNLRARVDRLGVGDRVHFLSFPRPEELPGLMGAATLYAAPAIDGRQRGRNVQRALAAGLPVLASDLPRVAHWVEHDRSGLLATPGDQAAWEDVIRTACGSPGMRSRWRTGARQVAEDSFGWPEITARFEELFLAATES